MTHMTQRFLFALCAVVVLTMSAGARAAEAESDATSPALTQEWIGFELTPASLALASVPARSTGHIDTFQTGPGAGVRVGRYRWQHTYVIPVQANLYTTSGGQTLFAQLQVEGGFIVGSGRRLELGIGVGIGMLAMTYATTCDGSCVVGGVGPLISIVARYLFIATPTWTLGASSRIIVPMSTPRGESIGYYTGSGSMMLGGLEVAFGRGSR
jgi:hypothetical protein